MNPNRCVSSRNLCTGQFDNIPQTLAYKPDIWPIDGLRPATITPEETVHYKLDTPSGILEWKTSFPRGRGVVYLRNSTSDPSHRVQAYRIALFHQIECLDVIRDQFVKQRANPSITLAPRAEYCLNYLKHSVLCHSDSHLEMVRSEYGGRSVLPYTPRSDCVDWEAVWRAAEENHRAHVEEHRVAGTPLE